MLVVITVTIIITISNVFIAEWENVHETPLSEAHGTDQKEPKAETESPVTNWSNIYEPILQMLACEVWPTPKGDTGRQWGFVDKNKDSGINITGFYSWIYHILDWNVE